VKQTESKETELQQGWWL